MQPPDGSLTHTVTGQATASGCTGLGVSSKAEKSYLGQNTIFCSLNNLKRGLRLIYHRLICEPPTPAMGEVQTCRSAAQSPSPDLTEATAAAAPAYGPAPANQPKDMKGRGPQIISLAMR